MNQSSGIITEIGIDSIDENMMMEMSESQE